MVAVGASFTGVTSRVMVPSAGPVASWSSMCTLMVVARSLSVVGKNATDASAAFTCASVPLTCHTPEPGL